MALESTISNVAKAAKRAVNAFATDNFTASGASGLYDRARPSYPPEAVSKLLSVLGSKKNAQIVEVGAGTGIFTQCLVKSPPAASKVGKILAVEPSPGMRQGFTKGFDNHISSGAKPEVEVVDGSFAEIPVADASTDIVVGAQCYHWSHPDYSSSIAEFARVLKPGAHLAFIWNLEDRKSTRWVAQLRDTYEAYELGTPQYRLDWWRACFETDAYRENFLPAERFDFSIIHPTTSQGVVDRVMSKSYITAQKPEDQEKIGASIRELLEKGEDRVWIDEAEGVFEYPYETNLYLMQKRSS